MCAATSRVPYMGILAILFVTMTMGPAEALKGYDCGGMIQIIKIVEIDDLKVDQVIMSFTQPDVFAFRYMGGPGYMAVMAGEVIHIVHCLPVEVKLNRVDKCYNRLPILSDNQSVFLMPRTHIITKYASVIPCNPALLEHYKLEGVWYKFMPIPVEAEEPIELKSSTQITWSYPSRLATDGIYKKKDIDSMRERIMLSIEQPIITETVVHQFTKGMRGTPSILNAFSDEMMDQLAETIWSRTWGKFIIFGPTFSGVIGVFVCFSLLTTVADSVLNGFKLYKVYGFSIYLVGACWDTLANILLNRAKGKEKLRKACLTDKHTSTKNQTSKGEEFELK